MTTNTLLWLYIVLLVAGGLMGFIKAKSRISLGTSLGFGLVIALSALRVLPFYVAPAVIGFLAIFFGLRFFKSKKFMPSGLMALVSVNVLVLLVTVLRG